MGYGWFWKALRNLENRVMREVMNERDEQLRRTSLKNMGHNVRDISRWSSQSRLVSPALQGSVEEVEQMMRAASKANLNLVVSLDSIGLPHHDGVVH